MSYSAYKFSPQTTNDGRDTEYRLLAQVTARLLALQDQKDTAHGRDRRELVDAVLWNRNIWAALRTDLLSDGNQLPKELRASLVSISIWIEKECVKVMDGKGDLHALIEVNRNIMAGLKPSHDKAMAEQGLAPDPVDTVADSMFSAAV